MDEEQRRIALSAGVESDAQAVLGLEGSFVDCRRLFASVGLLGRGVIGGAPSAAGNGEQKRGSQAFSQHSVFPFLTNILAPIQAEGEDLGTLFAFPGTIRNLLRNIESQVIEQSSKSDYGLLKDAWISFLKVKHEMLMDQIRSRSFFGLALLLFLHTLRASQPLDAPTRQAVIESISEALIEAGSGDGFAACSELVAAAAKMGSGLEFLILVNTLHDYKRHDKIKNSRPDPTPSSGD